MKIQLIAEGNTKYDRAVRHWGLSFLIDDDILFDTFGKPSVLMENIKKINIDILRIKHIIISHEHWDHINGLWDILSINNNVIVYVCRHTDEQIKDKIKSYGVELKQVDDELKIRENVFSIGEMISIDGSLYEQAICLKDERGLFVLTGCAHPGIVDIIKRVQSLYDENIYAVIGGFHLKDSNLVDIEHVISELKNIGINYFVPLHCTGDLAVNLFKEKLNCNPNLINT